MKIWHILILASTTYGALQCRFGVQVRREWRDVQETARVYFLSALSSTMRRPNANTPSFYDRLVQYHLDHAGHIHGYVMFFPWHRYMMAQLEQEMQRNGFQTALLYWNWGLDSSFPHLAPIWGGGNNKIGTNGNSQNGYCVTDGAFPNFVAFYRNSHCVTRNWGGSTMRSVTSNAVINNIIRRHNTGAFDAFRAEVEGVHNGVHISVGGDMGNMASPNDPVFYLHHANIDRVWWMWQRMYPQYANNYDGTYIDPNNWSVGAAYSTDQLTPFSATVAEAFNVRDLCYDYIRETPVENFFADIPESSEDAIVSVEFTKKVDKSKGYDLLRIEPSPPLPESTLKMNNLPVEQIRKFEAIHTALVEKMNEDPEKVPETALWSRPDMLQKLLDSNEKYFYGTLEGISVAVRVKGRPSAIDLMRKVIMSFRSAKVNVTKLQRSPVL